MFIRSNCFVRRNAIALPAKWVLWMACLLAVGVGSVRGKDPAWQLVKAEGREYVPVENLARFYQLQGSTQIVDHRVSLGDGRTRLEFGSNPNEVYVNGVKQWLSFPTLVQNDEILISRFDLAKTIEPCLRPSMISNLRPFHTVVIDAGHGGKDRGASSRLGAEKEYTLDVCRHLQQKLEALGLHVVMTRDDDNFLPLEDRADLANGVADAVFVSLHFNSASDGGSANGFEVYSLTPQGAASTADHMPSIEQYEEAPGNEFDNASLALATCVQSSILGHIPQADRGVRHARFAVLRLTRAPAILVEGGFLTSDQDSRNINDPAWRERLAEAIAQGVQSFQGLAVSGEPPKVLADYRGEQLPLLGLVSNPAVLAVRPAGRMVSVMPVANEGIPGLNIPPVRSGGGFPSVN